MVALVRLKTIIKLGHWTFASKVKTYAVGDLNPSLYSLHNHHFLSTESLVSAKQNLTVNYLIKSCGLSAEGAVSASRRLRLRCPRRADAVLALLRDQGFSKTQISKVFRSRAELLNADPEKTILPKLQYFTSLGVSKDDLAKVVASNPALLALRLETRIVPTYSFLRTTCLLSHKHVASIFKRCSRLFLEGHTKNVVPNIAHLRESGVSEFYISKLLAHFTRLMMSKPEEFVLVLREVEDMGFDMNTRPFVDALGSLGIKNSKSIVNRNRQVYMWWGWSDEDARAAFEKCPQCMIVSDKKIMQVMDFIVNKMGLPSTWIARESHILKYSLERRIIPRCSVVKLLLSKGLLNEDANICRVVILSKEQFFESFVTKFVDQVPQLLSVYQGNSDIF